MAGSEDARHQATISPKAAWSKTSHNAINYLRSLIIVAVYKLGSSDEPGHGAPYLLHGCLLLVLGDQIDIIGQNSATAPEEYPVDNPANRRTILLLKSHAWVL